MNRTAVILLSLAILVAHTLAIHQTPAGKFALPYEIAHVAFRIGRHLARDGLPLWNTGAGWVESYPSAAWVAVCAFAERLYVSPATLTQWVGILCSLATVAILAQFSRGRMSGLIAPLLLAASGSAAAAAASGTEASLAMLLATASYFAFETGRTRLVTVCTSLLVLTRPEGLVFVASLLVLELLDRPRGAEGGRRRRRPGAYLPALLLSGAATLFRGLVGGTWSSPFTAALLDVDGEQVRLGVHYLWSYLYGSGYGLVLLPPVLALASASLSARARRAGLLAGGWIAVVVLSGGDVLPFWNALVPALPLLFIAVQESMTDWMDRYPRLAWANWGLLAVSLVASLLASKLPGDVGPLPLERFQRAWMRPTEPIARAGGKPLGRLGLLTEIREVEELRPLGIFLRDKVDADVTVMTFWPGTLGYLSRRETYDGIGRAFPPTPGARCESWRGVPRVDLVATLARGADYLVPAIGATGLEIDPQRVLTTWLTRYDSVGPSERRLGELVDVLRDFELVCVPVPAHSEVPDVPSARPFALLRNRDLELTPRLEVRLSDDAFEVVVHHRGHRQVVDLVVSVRTDDGTVKHMQPNGRWVVDSDVHARTDILLYPTGQRPIRMLRASLPEGSPARRLVCRLHNPGMSNDVLFSAVGPATIVDVRR